MGKGKKSGGVKSATAGATAGAGAGGMFGSGIFGNIGTGVICKAEDTSMYCKLVKFVNVIMMIILILMIVAVIYYFVSPYIGGKNVFSGGGMFKSMRKK
jgi:hypothetical protein